MNRGLELADGELLVIMNPYVRIESGLNEMVEFLQMNRKVGAIAPMIVNKNGIIQDRFRNYITPLVFFRHLNRLLGLRKAEILSSPIMVD